MQVVVVVRRCAYYRALREIVSTSWMLESVLMSTYNLAILCEID
jgi:hypothetical protein